MFCDHHTLSFSLCHMITQCDRALSKGVIRSLPGAISVHVMWIGKDFLITVLQGSFFY